MNWCALPGTRIAAESDVGTCVESALASARGVAGAAPQMVVAAHVSKNVENRIPGARAQRFRLCGGMGCRG